MSQAMSFRRRNEPADRTDGLASQDVIQVLWTPECGAGNRDRGQAGRDRGAPGTQRRRQDDVLPHDCRPDPSGKRFHLAERPRYHASPDVPPSAIGDRLPFAGTIHFSAVDGGREPDGHITNARWHRGGSTEKDGGVAERTRASLSAPPDRGHVVGW